MTSLTDKRVSTILENMRRAPLLGRSKFKMTDMDGNTVMELFQPDHHRSAETYDPMTGSYHSDSERSGE